MRTLSYSVRRCLVALGACASVVLGGCEESSDAPLVGVDRASSLTWGELGMTNHTIIHDGIARTYEKYVPGGLPIGPVPLVFAPHGGGGTAGNLSSSTNPWFEWQVLADHDEFIVIYPNGVDNNWNDCRSDTEVNGNADDVGFISAVIDEVGASHHVNLKRVYATGISNGGTMSYRLAAELSNRIAAIGAVKHPQAFGGQNRDIEGIHEIWKILRKHTLAS